MVDRPPPSRFSVVERGGRLVVIDRETGQTPPTAAERMDLHDRKSGIEPNRPAGTSAAPDMSAAARAESGLSVRPAPAQQSVVPAPADSGKGRMATAERNQRPWKQPDDRPALKATRAPAPSASRPAPAAGGGGKTIITGKWWDAKGPRTITLGPKGRQMLNGGFVTLFFAVAIAAIVAFLVEPIILFVGGFLLFRFGGSILGPIGAGIVDKAIAEKG